jgi:hypothetical protein
MRVRFHRSAIMTRAWQLARIWHEDANPMLVLVDVTAKKLKAATDALDAARPQDRAPTAGRK